MTEPTREEIDKAIEYFKEPNERAAYNKYLKPLEEKHGDKWVEALLSLTLTTIIAADERQRRKTKRRKYKRK